MTLRAIHTRFPFGCEPAVLNLAIQHNSSDRSTKSTPSSFNALRLLVNTRFQVLFHSPPGVLFTFPSQYYSLSVTMEYLGLEGGPPGFPLDSSCPVVLWCCLGVLVLRIHDYYVLWARLSFRSFCSDPYCHNGSPQPRSIETDRFGLFRFRSPLLTESRLISFPEGTKMFQFPSYSLRRLWIHLRISGYLHRIGCPIRTSADPDMCSSPRLFAACHVLLRLMVPRHPPCALCNLTYLFSFRLLPTLFESPITSVQFCLQYFSCFKLLSLCLSYAVFKVLALSPEKISRHGTSSLRESHVLCPHSPHSRKVWWAQMESNHRPYAYQAYALTD